MNWGKSIMWVFIAFASGMMYLVYRATQTQFDLVEDDYYEQELAFQDQINQTQRAVEKGYVLSSWRGSEVISVTIAGLSGHVSGGHLWFYDAQDRKNDRQIALSASDSAYWEIPISKLSQDAVASDRYEIKGMWRVQNDTFRGVAQWK